jgi:hypothetical protein
VRVLTRLLREVREYVAVVFTNHLRRAKRRALAIQHYRRRPGCPMTISWR